MTIDEIPLGSRVRFKGDDSDVSYLVTFVGPKYFHIDIGDGRISGPYGPELVAAVVST